MLALTWYAWYNGYIYERIIYVHAYKEVIIVYFDSDSNNKKIKLKLSTFVEMINDLLIYMYTPLFTLMRRLFRFPYIRRNWIYGHYRWAFYYEVTYLRMH